MNCSTYIVYVSFRVVRQCLGGLWLVFRMGSLHTSAHSSQVAVSTAEPAVRELE